MDIEKKKTHSKVFPVGDDIPANLPSSTVAGVTDIIFSLILMVSDRTVGLQVFTVVRCGPNRSSRHIMYCSYKSSGVSICIMYLWSVGMVPWWCVHCYRQILGFKSKLQKA